jgi:DeoR family transcriptional regulator of aga operon
MVAASDRAVVVADPSKIGRADVGIVGALADFDLLVTAAGEAPTGHDERLRVLADAGLAVLAAP